MLPSLSALSFTRLRGEVETPAKSHPSRGTQKYKIAECPYCGDAIHVSAANYESQLAVRMACHLEACEHYHFTVPRLPGSRSLRNERKPSGKQRVMSQLYIDSTGRLAKHEFGTLLRCCAPSKRARDTMTARVSLAAGDPSDVLNGLSIRV